ncbi:MAG: protein-glutamate O-methyltransferase CheR [Proteobacteria bacterium]|nr:protein-glutamate O-methyltransferase CheR [Pseudomonadota bacterium]
MHQNLTIPELEKFADLAYQKTGIRISSNKLELMNNRLGRRLQELQLSSYENYYRYLLSNLDREINHFVKAITTNETYFFRCPLHFHLLSKEVFPHFRGDNLDIWSAACSTGEEPYSLAILTLERFPNVHSRRVRIFASDIDYSVLEKASEGIYSSYALRFVKPDLKKRYFAPRREDRFQIKPQLRKRILLGQHNLQNLFPKGKVDIVFCRNVLIYFDQQSKKRVYDNLLHGLRPGGYLFLGESEIVPDVPGFTRIKSSVLKKNK